VNDRRLAVTTITRETECPREYDAHDFPSSKKLQTVTVGKASSAACGKRPQRIAQDGSVPKLNLHSTNARIAPLPCNWQGRFRYDACPESSRSPRRHPPSCTSRMLVRLLRTWALALEDSVRLTTETQNSTNSRASFAPAFGIRPCRSRLP
jgi:hypothetical protein